MCQNFYSRPVRGCIQKFPDWVYNEITTINTRWEATQRVMAAKLTRLSQKNSDTTYLVAESCTICSSRSRQPVRKLLDTPSYRRREQLTEPQAKREEMTMWQIRNSMEPSPSWRGQESLRGVSRTQWRAWGTACRQQWNESHCWLAKTRNICSTWFGESETDGL
jgi:hypothetical protein